MTTLRRFTPPTKTNSLHIQESIQPDEVVLQIETCGSFAIAEVRMTQAQFRELCRLGRPDRESYYTANEDQVRFQSGSATPG